MGEGEGPEGREVAETLLKSSSRQAVRAKGLVGEGNASEWALFGHSLQRSPWERGCRLRRRAGSGRSLQKHNFVRKRDVFPMMET